MEKGAYRLRGPRRRAISTDQNVQLPSTGVLTTNMIFLLVLLAAGAISCFGSAYYLFATRWATTNLPRPGKSGADEGLLQVLEIDTQPKLDDFKGDILEKFLAYLPHSGFHNQRIALENALTLSRLLNRTLLMPPVRLGNKPLGYAKFDTLKQSLLFSHIFSLASQR